LDELHGRAALEVDICKRGKSQSFKLRASVGLTVAIVALGAYGLNQARLHTRDTSRKLPPVETLALLTTVSDAVELARVGHVAEGYSRLLGGLRRAEAARDAGESWGDELVGLYRQELDNHQRRYGNGWPRSGTLNRNRREDLFY
jgi:hypothetical protein